MDELNTDDVIAEWKTPNSSEFGSLDSSCVKRLDFEVTDEIINRMDDLELATTKCTHGNGDGNDSGVDTGATNPVQLQRALSNNSAGYASSSGGLDAQFASCNSSLLSVCSDSHDGKTTVLSCKGSVDCTSENGSESSSLSGDKQRQRQTPPKKRVGLAEPNQSKSPRSSDGSINKARTRATSANRMSNGRNFGAPMLATTERARSRDKQITSNSQTSPTKRPKPGSLPTSAKDCTTPIQKSSTLRRAASVTRRTPSVTPSTEDGRWPSNQFRSASKVQNRTANDTLIIKTKVGPIVLDNKVDRFSTMPRRKKVKSEEDLSEWRSNRSSSTTRDRMSTSTIVRRQSTRESPNKPISAAFPPRYQKPTLSKTLIYHEASIQTALTSQDIDDAFDGNAKEIRIDAVATVNRHIQCDIRDKEIEELQEKIQIMTAENKILRQNLVERSQMLSTMEQQLNHERDEKIAMKQELQSNTERVLGMLELVNATPKTETDTTCDSLLMLESQIQLSGHALEEKQCEINKLRKFCDQLQVEMNRSIQVQKSLLEEKKCFEKESSELQDFLQDEKTAIFEALKDAESEIEEYQTKMKQKEQEVERLQDECRHLVRISEQRRQEFLGMQTKYAALESKCKMLLSQPNHAVSGATLALSDLGSRLNDLVEQLIASYNISEQELEDGIYHNEAYANSDESSPESEQKSICNGIASPQRHHSFIAAVINAIKSAASTAKDKVNQKVVKSHSILHENGDGSEMLDSETEPCLMMENVLEDVPMPDSHTHNLISTSMIASMSSNDADNQEDSLHNLCEAIANRQKIEEQTTLMMMNQSVHSERDAHDRESMANSSSSEQESGVQNLVDHVINVDNLVTKLLKVLRIIQMDNDNCIQQLVNDKNTLQLNAEESTDKLKDADERNSKLKDDLDETTKQLINNCNDLAQSHEELKKSRREISKLNEDICSLSTLCSTNSNESEAISKDGLLDAIEKIQCENGRLTEAELTSLIRSLQNEVPKESECTNAVQNDIEKTKLNGLELNSNLQNGAGDIKSQNDTITKAIETLNGIQSIVRQCPALADLQRDLEQMLPSDLNANVE